MKLTFRWYGDNDPVTLDSIRQIPAMSGIVSAVYDVKPGGIWSQASIAHIREEAAACGLAFEVVESVPVPEKIKLGTPEAVGLIENYCENIRRLGQQGIKCICYNFMPVFDWLRSELDRHETDGANALAYDEQAMMSRDPLKSDLALPGWDTSYTREELRSLIAAYHAIGEAGLRRNLAQFLEAVIPVAAASGVNLAIHPDDPPWEVFGLPRIVKNRDDIQQLFDMVPDPANGLTLCTGSLGADPANDLIDMVHRFAGRIHFVHLRNIRYTGVRSFEEVGHPTVCGSVDMYGVARALVETGFNGYVRPDHGRMIWGETGRKGYGLYDRALGAAYLTGLFEAIEKEKKHE